MTDARIPAPMALPDQATLVRRRNGSVLTRGLVLKTDHPNVPLPHLPRLSTTAKTTAMAATADALANVSLQGAPNFRAAAGDLGVYGTAQPTLGGLKTILALLGCRPPSTPAQATAIRTGPRSRRGSAQPPVTAASKGLVAETAPSPSDRRASLAAPTDDTSASAASGLGAASAHEQSSTKLNEQRDSSRVGHDFEYSNSCIWVCTREEPVIYVSGRPFVLREASAPTETFGLSTRASNLESIERRLRADILSEAERNGGLVLVHEEISSGGTRASGGSGGTEAGLVTGQGAFQGSATIGILSSNTSGASGGTALGATAHSGAVSPIRLTPTWIAVDETNVQTPRQVWDSVRLAGWRVSYHRIPIANEQAIENNYLDAYTELLRNCDPLTTSVVANCGVGFVRTTFAMCAAMIIRRRQMMIRSSPDPLKGPMVDTASPPRRGVSGDSLKDGLQRGRTSAAVTDARILQDSRPPSVGPRSRSAEPHHIGTAGGVVRSLQMASALQAHDASVLKLLHVLSTTPAPTPAASFTFGAAIMSSGGGSQSAFGSPFNAGADISPLNPAILIPTLIAHPPLLNALRAANAGDYGVVRQLLGLLDDGSSAAGGQQRQQAKDQGGGADGSVSSKQIVDWAIDSCDQLLNLREAILQERLRYAVGDHGHRDVMPNLLATSGSSANGATGSPASPVHLYRASKHLEKYLFLLAFASYVSGSLSARFEYRFADWLRDRREIWGIIGRMRGAAAAATAINGSGAGAAGRMLAFFDPIADLSLISGTPLAPGIHTSAWHNGGATRTSRDGSTTRALAGSINSSASFGEGTFAGDEFAEHVVRSRAGVVLRPFMLLKNDIWFSFDEDDVVHGGTVIGRSGAGAGASLIPRSNIGPRIRGSVNFRRVAQSHVFATGQPTVEGIIGVVQAVCDMLASEQAYGDVLVANETTAFRPHQTVTWINLREEPLVYIGSRPFCLRQSAKSLRNIKNYSGISWRRLNLLEDRLKADVIAELRMGEGSLLLHNERENGIVEPTWEQVREEDIMTVQEVMDMVRQRFLTRTDDGDEGLKIELDYRRIPITAEKPPELSDMAHILRTVLRARVDQNPVVLNDQLGRGRSSMTACIVLLVQRWMGRDSQHDHDGNKNKPDNVDSKESTTTTAASRLSYHVINSLLRVLANGLRIKAQVDDAIDACAAVTNLRESIELARLAAEDTQNERERRKWISNGVQSLRKYFQLIIFQAYLESVTPAELLEKELARPTESMQLGLAIPGPDELDDEEDAQGENDSRTLSVGRPKPHRNRDGSIVLSSFEQFVASQPVFQTIARGFNKVEMETIMPLQKVEAGDGLAMADEVADVVQSRTGSILSAFTMLKSDFFVGIVKAGLKERIEGAPNLRGVPMILHPPISATSRNTMAAGDASGSILPSTPSTWVMRRSESTAMSGSGPEGIQMEAWGSGMPTVDGLRRALARMGAGPGGLSEVVWTSLREEPVLYVNGRPHVLRLADQPLTNVEATGVTTEVVESMEQALKQDVLKEAASRKGRLLLHDEVEGQRGNFEVIPIWESVGESDVLTPREVYDLIISEGFRVDYARLAITDEQAPIPDVFTQLEKRVQLALDTGSACVFNCQMGRGRTTTGMIIASLVSTVTWYGAAILNDPSILDDEPGQTSERDGQVRDMVMDREDQVYLAGEYRVILQLVGVLNRGKSAKKLADKAIDRMEAVQNLRKAIYDSKLRMDGADAGTKKHKHLATVFANYLQRYGYLITFANYLLEKAHANVQAQADADADGGTGEGDEDGADSMIASVLSFSGGGGRAMWGSVGGPTADFPSFADWLRSRREILSILDRTE